MSEGISVTYTTRSEKDPFSDLLVGKMRAKGGSRRDCRGMRVCTKVRGLIEEPRMEHKEKWEFFFVFLNHCLFRKHVGDRGCLLKRVRR